MRSISSFFERLKNLTVPDGARRDAVCRALRDVLGVEVDRARVRIDGGVAYLNVSPSLKAEVQFKEQELIANISRTLGERVVAAVR